MTEKRPLQDFTPVELLTALRELKETIDAISAEAAALQDPLKKRLKVIESELIIRANDEGVKSFNTDVGVATTVKKVDYVIDDYDAWVRFVIESKDLSFYGKSVAKASVDAYVKQHNRLPPGIKGHPRVNLQFRKKN